ncbi:MULTISPECIES: glycosyl hydrolase family 28-related protein [unclassified Sphingomonas]|nr:MULTISPECIES: glycosyl hydrolase family 28-related protein [unclassified Sphingomonas]MBN8812722.1 right-handed parallel beta-helix repeat-containing protein [Sphingomonas sp.]
MLFNVKDFGAIGDGVTDDTPAFQLVASTIDSLNGGVVYIPRGTYLLTDHFAFSTGNLHIYGDGIGLSTILVGAWIDGIRVANGYPAAVAVVDDVLIENLSINGNRSNYTPGPSDTHGNGINLNAVNRVTVRNCEVYDVAEQGIVSTYWNATELCDHLVIDNNIVRDCQTSRISIGLEGRVRASRVTNNTVIGNRGIGIYVGHNTGSGENGEVIVGHNRVEGAASEYAVGIYIEDYVFDCLVTSNIVVNNNIGIRASVNTGPTARHQLNNNTILQWTQFGIINFPLTGADRSFTQIATNRIYTDVAEEGSVAIVASAGTSVQANMIRATGPGNAIGIAAAGDGVRFISNDIDVEGYSLSDAGKADVVALSNFITTDVNFASSSTQASANLGATPIRWTRANLGAVVSTLGLPTTAGVTGLVYHDTSTNTLKVS